MILSEASRKRLALRWLTLAEFVGVAALVIAGLSYWDSHRERAAAAREHQEEVKETALKLSFVMTGTPNDAGDKVRLSSVHPEQAIQTQTLWFPLVIRGDSVETTGNPRIEAHWFDDGLRKAAGKTKQGRMPVGVLTVFIEDGQTKTDRSVYYLAYSLHPRLLRRELVQLEGLSLARRGVAGDLQTAAGSLWAAQ